HDSSAAVPRQSLAADLIPEPHVLESLDIPRECDSSPGRRISQCGPARRPVRQIGQAAVAARRDGGWGQALGGRGPNSSRTATWGVFGSVFRAGREVDDLPGLGIESRMVTPQERSWPCPLVTDNFLNC